MKLLLPKKFLVIILLSGALTASAQTIKVSATAGPLTQTIANGSTFDASGGGFINMKDFLPVTVTIENTGSAALNLSCVSGSSPCRYIAIGGTGASDFTTNETNLTGVIPAGQSQTFTVNLAPTASNGLKTVSLTILSNDAVNASYTGSIKYNLANITTDILKAADIGLSLYPNPSADGHFMVQGNADIQKIVVTTVNGTKEEFYGKEFTTTLKGLLMVQLYTNKGIVSEKVLVQ